MVSAALNLAVVGAGPVGLALALHAARTLPQAQVTLFDARPADKDVSGDPRTLALSLGSVQLLKRLGAWDGSTAQPIAEEHDTKPDREEHLDLDHDRRKTGRHAELHAEKQQPELEDADRQPVGDYDARRHSRAPHEEHERNGGEQEPQGRECERRHLAQAHLDRDEREPPESDDRKQKREVARREVLLHFASLTPVSEV